MQRRDTKQFSKLTEGIMLDYWEKYEKGYYPKKAVDFDISAHSRKYYRYSLTVETNFAFIAEENDRIVGVAVGRLVGESGLARLGWIGVHLTHRNKDIGTVLLEKVIEHCRVEGCHKITFYALSVLIPAVNLYVKCGFCFRSVLAQRVVER